MKCSPLFVLFAIAPVVAAETQDIQLTDGRLLKAARIVSIGERQVSIIHAGGATAVALEAVPLEVLARANMALEATAAERKKKEAETVLRISQRVAAEKAKHDEEIQLRLALAAVRDTGETIVTGKSSADLDARLLALKSNFPLKRLERVSVYISNARSTKRRDVIEIEVPGSDVWTYYRGMIQTTTMEALPVTLKRVDDRVKSDLAEYAKRGASADEAARAQADLSAKWINRELKSFLSQLRALLAP